jgi:uncharacterized membrane protein
MRHRMAVAVLALLGLLSSVYLLLYKLGVVGSLVCGGSGACERVQQSPYAVFLGIPVAAYGVAGFAALLVVALVGLGERWADRAAPSRLLVAFAVVGCCFAAYLTYLEVAVIHDVCRWCAFCALLITAILVLSVLGARSFSRAPAP